MSLNRIASLESFSFAPSDPFSRRGSEVSVRARKLSFNPLPEEWEPPSIGVDVQPVGAFEVPTWKRIAQIAVTVVYALLSAGIIFGYAALKPVLKSQGAYHDLCSVSNDTEDDIKTCVEIRLNFMFTVAAVATNVAALPIGAVLDYMGPRACGVMGSLFLACGAVIMAYAAVVPFDGYLIGYLFLALGGPFSYISAFHLSNAFPRNAGLILALLTGAFDASSALFLVYRVVYERTHGAFGHRHFFLSYLAVPVAILILQLTLLPSQSYKTAGELVATADEALEQEEFADAHPYDDQVDEHTSLLREERRARRESVIEDIQTLLGGSTKKAVDRRAAKEEASNERSGVWGVMHGRTAAQQIASPWFVLICLFTAVQMTRINYFVATVRPQYEALLGSHSQAIEINHFFDIALPLGGLISIPFTGIFLDNTSTVIVLAVLASLAAIIGAFGVLPYSWAAYVNISLFVLYRPFYYTSVSDYVAKVFGFRTFGTVYGAVICIAGLFNFAQSGLDFLFHDVCDGNPVPVNLALLTVGLMVGASLVSFVAVRGSKARRAMLEDEAENAFSR